MMGNTNIFTLCSREQAINLRAVRISFEQPARYSTFCRRFLLISIICLAYLRSGTALTLKSG